MPDTLSKTANGEVKILAAQHPLPQDIKVTIKAQVEVNVGHIRVPLVNIFKIYIDT